jgi:hypothetical protein
MNMRMYLFGMMMEVDETRRTETRELAVAYYQLIIIIISWRGRRGGSRSYTIYKALYLAPQRL